MSKKSKINFESKIISQIKNDEIRMKSKWYFALGSSLMFVSLVGLSMGVVFFVNLGAFLIRRNSPHFMTGRLELTLASFPWWVPTIAIVGVILAIWLLKKYDFSYKKNFPLIIVSFLASMLLAGLLFDRLGLNDYLAKGRRMGRFYQRLELHDGSGGSVNGIRKYNKQFEMRQEKGGEQL